METEADLVSMLQYRWSDLWMKGKLYTRDQRAALVRSTFDLMTRNVKLIRWLAPFVRLHIVLEPIKSSANCVDNNEMYDQEFL